MIPVSIVTHPDRFSIHFYEETYHTYFLIVDLRPYHIGFCEQGKCLKDATYILLLSKESDPLSTTRYRTSRCKKHTELAMGGWLRFEMIRCLLEI